MRFYDLVKLILVAPWLSMAIVCSIAAEPLLHRDYYSVQIVSGSLVEAQDTWRKFQQQPFARIEKHTDTYELRIGFWNDKAEADKQLAAIKQRFPRAFVFVAEYNPRAIVVSWPDKALPEKQTDTRTQPVPITSGVTKPNTLPSNIISATANKSEIASLAENRSEAVITPQRHITGLRYSFIPQIDQIEAAEPSPPEEEKSEEKPAAPRQRVKPDERPLWKMLQEERYENLQAEIARLQSKHQRWQPPRELLDLLQQGILRKDIARFIHNGDMAALTAHENTHAEAFSCAHIDWAWALAEAQAKLNQTEAFRRTLHHLIPGCNEQDRLATLYKMKPWLSDGEWEALLAREAEAVRSSEGESKFRRLRYDDRMEKLLAAHQTENKSAFRALLQQLSDDIEFYRDTDAALLGGWHYFNEQDSKLAVHWFNQALSWNTQTSDAYRGLALSALQEKRFSDAKRFAEALPDNDQSKPALLRDIATAMKSPPRFLAMAGGETNAGTTYSAAYAGLIAPIHSRFGGLGNGFVQRWWVDRLTYSYDNNGKNTEAEQLGAEGSLGYQKSGAWGSWAFFAGAVYRHTNFSPDAPDNPARSGFVRGRIQVEGERILNPDWRINVNANYVTGQDSYWARGRVLYNVNRRMLVGPEAIVLGDPNFQIRQYGGVVMGLNVLSIADVAVRGGAREANDGTTFYFGLELARPF